MSGSVITPELRARVRGWALPVALMFGRLGLTPNVLTVVGLLIAMGAATAAAQQAWVAAGVLVIVGGVFDLLDGSLARATNRVTRLGGFLDSVFDRWGEGLVYAGIIVGALDADFDAGVLLGALAMSAAFMVSYTRAKSESLGFTPGTGMAAIGIAPREVRLVILTVGLLLTGIAGGVSLLGDSAAQAVSGDWARGRWPLALSLGLIALLATITTIQRILHVVRQPATEEHE